MSNEHDGKKDGDGKSLSSTEYRSRLLNKLNCLVSVLEIAIGKVEKSLEADDTNQERLQRIKANLENTLAICRRAKSTLESKGREDKPMRALEAPRKAKDPKKNENFRCYVELSSIDEFRKFKSLPAIDKDEVKGVDLDDLADKLLGND